MRTQLLALSLVSAVAVAGPRKWSEAQFEPNVKAMLQSQYPGAKITRFEDDAYRVEKAPDLRLEVRFVKARAECREAWNQCEGSVQHVLAALVEAGHHDELKVAQLRIVLRANDKIAEIHRRGIATYTRPFSSDAQWMLAADNREMIRLGVTPEQVKLKPDEAWKAALAATTPTEVATAEAGPILVYQSDYAPSALLFPERLEAAVHKRHPELKGHLLAVCPEENILLYTIGGSAQVADLRSGAIRGAKDSQMPLSTAVMEWRDGSWHEAK